MELKKYLYPLRRWWWLLVAATLVAAISSFLVTLQQPPVYQSRTTLMIGRAIEDPNPSASEFYLGQQLAATYADIAERDIVKNATMAALGVTWLPNYQARVVPNSQLIEIVVTDTSPQRAQLVASTLANQLILQSPTSARPDEVSRQQFVSQQLDTLETQIKQTQEDISKLQAELGNMVSARQITDTQNQISALQAKLTSLQSNYASLLSNTQGGAVNTLTVIEPAAVPGGPVGPNRALSILVAAMIGFALASGAAYLLEYLDDTLKSPEEIQSLLGAPIIGYIAEDEEGFNEQPFVTKYPRHPISEAFRSLRTNLEFAAVDRPLQTLLVTSSDAEEGKTSIAANLAVIVSQGDKKVVVIDADMRQPSMHTALGLPNEYGLSDVFRGKMALQSAMHRWKNEMVAVITGGSPPPNPAELLGSKKMDQILVSLEEVADMVIIDGPPFIVTDAAILAAKVDGVLMVVRPGFTRQDTARAMAEQVRRSGARVVGVVLNRIPRKIAEYYGGQLYLSAPYYAGGPYGGGKGDGGQGTSGGLTRQPGFLRALASRFNGWRAAARKPAARKPAAPKPGVAPAQKNRAAITPADVSKQE